MSNATEKLQDALGMIDDEFIEEAHDDKPNTEQEWKAKPRVRAKKSYKLFTIAACLVLAVGIGAFALANAAGLGSSKTAEVEAVNTAEVDIEATDATTADSGDSPGEARSGSMKELSLESDSSSGITAMSADGYAIPGMSVGVPGDGLSKTDDVQANMLTAAEWNDHANWPFFTNLVNAGTIEFPSFGIDPRHRVKVSVADAAGNAARGVQVVLRDADNAALWTAATDKNGVAYLFYLDGQTPANVTAAGVEQSLVVPFDSGGQQGAPVMRAVDDVSITIGSSGNTPKGLQVMFIVDTTGSMADEIAYLQADFSAIAGDVGNDGVTYSVNFYRDKGDEYVTKCNDFTGDVAAVQRLLNDEYADGGGDTPEAVAQILTETITDNAQWRDDCSKVAFLIFDAPPHEGTEQALDAAVRSAATRGIKLVPVVASNAERDTELFGRALAICTNGTYVFLTDDSGIGDAHLEPIVGDYTVESLHDVIVRIIEDNR